MNEEVMVVESSDLQPYLAGRPAAIIQEDSAAILRLIDSEHFFVDRAIAEVSPKWRQIIPYVVVRHRDSFFLLQRTRKQNEARLHGKLSLGIGGHINPGYDLMTGLRKELEEEVQIDDAYELAFAGILNDEATEVGRVHLGAVYILSASSDRVCVLETEKMKGEWAPLAGLRECRAAMESWSQIVYDQLLDPNAR
jgi:predicted NUDIX family phosphoesterase